MQHYDDVRYILAAQQGEQATSRTDPYRPGVEFSVACLPIPQPRQRHRVIRSGPKAYATNYTPAKHPVNGFKQVVALAARKAWCGHVPYCGPVEVRLRLRFPLPSSARASVRRRIEAGDSLPHAVRPDVDNCTKSIFDCLIGICWEDDKQIARLTVEKIYTNEPGVDVRIAEWGV